MESTVLVLALEVAAAPLEVAAAGMAPQLPVVARGAVMDTALAAFAADPQVLAVQVEVQVEVHLEVHLEEPEALLDPLEAAATDFGKAEEANMDFVGHVLDKEQQSGLANMDEADKAVVHKAVMGPAAWVPVGMPMAMDIDIAEATAGMESPLVAARAALVLAKVAAEAVVGMAVPAGHCQNLALATAAAVGTVAPAWMDIAPADIAEGCQCPVVLAAMVNWHPGCPTEAGLEWLLTLIAWTIGHPPRESPSHHHLDPGTATLCHEATQLATMGGSSPAAPRRFLLQALLGLSALCPPPRPPPLRHTAAVPAAASGQLCTAQARGKGTCRGMRCGSRPSASLHQDSACGGVAPKQYRPNSWLLPCTSHIWGLQCRSGRSRGPGREGWCSS